MKLIRFLLGGIILFINKLTQPRHGERDAAAQAEIEQQLQHYSLYQFSACPFCVKVRRELRRLNLPLDIRDAKAEPYRSELQQQGGKIQVPCLRIEKSDGEVEWLYESDAIIDCLRSRFPL